MATSQNSEPFSVLTEGRENVFMVRVAVQMSLLVAKRGTRHQHVPREIVQYPLLV